MPLIFPFHLTKYQINEKALLKNFIDELFKGNNYRAHYASSGRKGKTGETFFIFPATIVGRHLIVLRIIR